MGFFITVFLCRVTSRHRDVFGCSKLCRLNAGAGFDPCFIRQSQQRPAVMAIGGIIEA
ncbi:MAG: hypothetical protein V9E86_11480 [Nitrosomonas sp.]